MVSFAPAGALNLVCQPGAARFALAPGYFPSLRGGENRVRPPDNRSSLSPISNCTHGAESFTLEIISKVKDSQSIKN
jgi:hypothetical protein